MTENSQKEFENEIIELRAKVIKLVRKYEDDWDYCCAMRYILDRINNVYMTVKFDKDKDDFSKTLLEET